MNKTLKKVLIFIALLVVVVLIIVLIALLFPKSKTAGTTPASPSASSAISPSPSVSATPSTASSPSLSPSPTPSPTDEGSVVTEVTADNVKYTITVPKSYATYSVTVDKGTFTLVRDSGGDLFKSVKYTRASVKFTFLPGVKAVAAAPSFLDSYIKYTNFEQSGKNYISGTKLAGETVTADDGKTQVTAWLVDTERGVLAVVMSLDLTNQITEQPQLDKLLSTLTLAS